jgi:hypothetical protein
MEVTRMRLRSGVHAQLEEAATEMIRKSLEGVTKRSDKSDILTPWKERDRLSREVYNSLGAPDAAIRKGMFNRAWNPTQPHLNSRDGIARPNRIPAGLDEFMARQTDSSEDISED